MDYYISLFENDEETSQEEIRKWYTEFYQAYTLDTYPTSSIRFFTDNTKNTPVYAQVAQLFDQVFPFKDTRFTGEAYFMSVIPFIRRSYCTNVYCAAQCMSVYYDCDYDCDYYYNYYHVITCIVEEYSYDIIKRVYQLGNMEELDPYAVITLKGMEYHAGNYKDKSKTPLEVVMERFANPIPTMIRRLNSILSWQQGNPKLAAQWCLQLSKPLRKRNFFQEAVTETTRNLLKYALDNDYEEIYFHIVRRIIEGTHKHSRNERSENRLETLEEQGFVHMLYEAASMGCYIVSIVFTTLGLSCEQTFISVGKD